MWFVWLLVFILGISAIVIIHEAAHYLFARMAGMEVAEFSIGFGPAIYQRKGKETTFSIRLIPMGGYVAVLTEQAKEMIHNVQQANIESVEEWERIKKQAKPFDIEQDYSEYKTYEKMTYWRKSLFVLGGVMSNYLLSVIILLFIYGINGEKVITEQTMITESEISVAWDKNNWDAAVDVENNDHLAMEERFLYAEKGAGNVWEPMVETIDQNNDGRWTFLNRAPFNFKNSKIKNTCVNLGYTEFGGGKEDQGCVVDDTGDFAIPKEGEVAEYNESSEYIANDYKEIYTQASKFVDGGHHMLNSAQDDWSYGSYMTMELEYNGTEYLVSLPSQRLVEVSGSASLSNVSYSYYTYPGEIFNNGSAVIGYEKMNAGQVIGKSLGDPFVYSIEMFLMVGQAFVPDEILSDNIGFRQVKDNGANYSTSASGVFMWGVLISSNLFLFNLFPWPPLDGWKFAEATYEKASKKKVNPKFEKALKVFGNTVTITLLVIILFW